MIDARVFARKGVARDDRTLEIQQLEAERRVMSKEILSLAGTESEQAAVVAEHERVLADYVSAHGLADGRVAERRQTIATARPVMGAVVSPHIPRGRRSRNALRGAA